MQGHPPNVVWWIILFGGVITVGFTYLFGFHDFRMHVVMTMTVAASLALVVVLIVELDWPFRGEVSISPDAYIKTQKSWSDLPFNTGLGRTGDAPQGGEKLEWNRSENSVVQWQGGACWLQAPPVGWAVRRLTCLRRKAPR